MRKRRYWKNDLKRVAKNLFNTTTLSAGLTEPDSPAQLIMQNLTKEPTIVTDLTTEDEPPMTAEDQRNYVRTSYREKRIIEAEIEKLLERHDGAYCRYKPGHSDLDVMKSAGAILNREITSSMVSYVRREIFGSIKAPPKSPEPNGLRAEVEALKAQVATLTEKVRVLLQIVGES